MGKLTKNFMKISLFVSFCVLINFLIIEVCIFYFSGMMKKKHSRNLSEMTIPAPIGDGFKKYHDNRLGWDTRYETPYGERPRAKAYTGDYLAAFGDSFTFCADVQDHETWEEYLAEMLQSNVYNFGVGAYGTDQAYLKFIEYSESGRVKTKVVTLSIIMENINRIVSTYRKFYTIVTGCPRTKPRFKLVKAHELYSAEDELILIPNPIQDENDLQRLTDVSAIPSIGRFDYFFQKHLYWNAVDFPYSRQILSPAFRRKVLDIFLERVNRLYLWRDMEARGIMFKIIDNFVSRATTHGLVPIIMILPMKEDLIYRVENGENPAPINLVEAYCRRKQYLCFNPISRMADAVITGGTQVKRLIEGHARPAGNRLIAKNLFNFLKANDLLLKE